jgi:hypothetical protein
MKKHLHTVADGILFQFLMVGSLSFSHIHDVVAAHGQAGWKSWLYPLSVDLLTVAAFRKIRNGQGGGFTWLAFLLGLSASLAANVIDSWTATPVGRALAVAIGVWPAVALLVCTLLAHDDAPATATPATPVAPARVAPAPATRTVAPVAVAPVSHPAASAVTASVAAPKPKPVAPKPATAATKQPARPTINPVVLDLMAQHGVDNVTGQMVADALGAHKATGCRHLSRVKADLEAGKLKLPAPAAATP